MASGILQCPNCGCKLKTIPIKNSDKTTFENTVPLSFAPEMIQVTPPDSSSFWQSDAVTNILIATYGGVVLLGVSWWYRIDAEPYIAGGMLFTGIGLHVLKLWLHRPAQAPISTAPTNKDRHITIETTHTDENGHKTIYRDHINDSRISDADLATLGHILTKEPDLAENFSKAQITRLARISQRRYDVIVTALKKERLAFVSPNNRTVLTPRCVKFLKRMAALPSRT
jgi:hypothetical protein